MATDYSLCRDLIQDGDVLLFHGRGFWSSVITLRTSSRITHAGICARWKGRLFVLEAKEKIGVRAYPLSEYLRDKAYDVYWYRIEDERIDRERVVDYALEKMGQRYANWRQFFRSWVVNLFNRTPDTDVSRFHCSEYVIGSLQAGATHPHELTTYIASRVPPGELVFLTCLKNMGLIVA